MQVIETVNPEALIEATKFGDQSRMQVIETLFKCTSTGEGGLEIRAECR